MQHDLIGFYVSFCAVAFSWQRLQQALSRLTVARFQPSGDFAPPLPVKTGARFQQSRVDSKARAA